MNKRIKRGPPPLPAHVGGQNQITIDVDRTWLLPTLPEEGVAKKREESRTALLLPPVLVAKPRGKLPPPIPREESDSADAGPPQPSRWDGREYLERDYKLKGARRTPVL
jgi:hypothetical protein